jgi:Spy/CpxP family protein refolding chaperone
MKSTLTKIFLPGLVLAGIMVAQTPQPSPGPAPTAGTKRMHRKGGRLHRLVQQLNLSPDQKTQAKAIFEDGRANAQPLTAQMREARAALANAVKSNAPEAEIDRLSNNAGAVASQLTAVRTKTLAKLYTILTPDQKEKLNTVMDRRTKA